LAKITPNLRDMDQPSAQQRPERANHGGKRLSRADWIDAAIRVLVGSSVEQVRVEKLAVDLGASKGSFYWHFKDRGALLDAVLDEWRSRSTLAVEVRLAQAEPSPVRRILRIMQLPLRSESAARAADLELAIMGWARRSEATRQAVQAVDRARVAHLADLFGELGLAREDAELRAHQAYALLRYVAQRSDMTREALRVMIERVHHDLTRDLPAGTNP
jgi:AcrR family transcriptional regulator